MPQLINFQTKRTKDKSITQECLTYCTGNTSGVDTYLCYKKGGSVSEVQCLPSTDTDCDSKFLIVQSLSRCRTGLNLSSSFADSTLNYYQLVPEKGLRLFIPFNLVNKFSLLPFSSTTLALTCLETGKKCTESYPDDADNTPWTSENDV